MFSLILAVLNKDYSTPPPPPIIIPIKGCSCKGEHPKTQASSWLSSRHACHTQGSRRNVATWAQFSQDRAVIWPYHAYILTRALVLRRRTGVQKPRNPKFPKTTPPPPPPKRNKTPPQRKTKETKPPPKEKQKKQNPPLPKKNKKSNNTWESKAWAAGSRRNPHLQSCRTPGLECSGCVILYGPLRQAAKSWRSGKGAAPFERSRSGLT